MFQVGDEVSYHSFIGGPVSSTGHKIYDIEMMPNNFGCNVAWISGKRGCVALDALSNEKNPVKPEPKKLTRSQKRYQEYLDSECSYSFREYMGFPNKKKKKVQTKW